MDAANPRQMKELRRVIKFVLDNADLKLKIEPQKNDFEIYFLNGKSDSDFAGDKDERKSITGWLVFLWEF